MESKIFSIGDIVTLKSHPYVLDNSAIIISGDHLSLPPLMIVAEIAKSSYKVAEIKHATYKCACMWFSPKSYRFELSEIYEDQLKLIQSATVAVDLTGAD